MNRKKSVVFTPKKIGKMEIRNRLVKSATMENAASLKGEVTDALIGMYSKLARGGVGMIVTGAAAAYSKNNTFHHGMRVHDDRFIPGLSRLAKAVHEADRDCRIVLQVSHQGRQVPTPESGVNLMPYLPPAFVKYISEHPEVMVPEEGEDVSAEPTGPSAIFDNLLQQTPRALTVEEIESIIDSFAEAIRRAQEADFDGVQIHAAHGWLLSSFLSPHTNKRDDRYGGSMAGRMRIVQEIYEKARKRVGADFPILAKLNTTDFFPDGMQIKEAVAMAEGFSKLGFDAIEASGGMWESLVLGEKKLGWKPYMLTESRVGIDTKDKEAYFLEGAREIKRHVRTPVMLVGGNKSFSRIEEILEQGEVDFISMARPLVRQPDLPNIWLTGGPDRARCISCNACFSVGNKPLSCKRDK
jgi:2,4-dienoyl-CoA reductase-like NADH-dependent reductase (Old Yellow Enzyme family)